MAATLKKRNSPSLIFRSSYNKGVVRSSLLLIAAGFVLSAAGPAGLTLQNLTFTEYEDGPPLARAHLFQAGETLFLNFRIAGYSTFSDTDEVKHVKLSWTIDTKDPQSRLIAPPESGKVDTALDQEDKKWMPKVRYMVEIPSQAASGTYRLTIHLDDGYSKSGVSNMLEIPVKGQDIEPSDHLVVRNLQFFRAEEDRQPLSANFAYRQGDTVWLRFDMTGFRVNPPKNEYSVNYGVALLDSSGKALFSAPNAAADAQESFYPKRFVPASLSLNLDKSIRPGQYTVVITATDVLAGVNTDQRRQFSVE